MAALGVGCFVLQYIVELISYYFTYGKAYRDTADKRIAYIQKLRRQPLGFFSSKESGELISSFSEDFANVEYTLCYWLPYPLGVGAVSYTHLPDRGTGRGRDRGPGHPERAAGPLPAVSDVVGSPCRGTGLGRDIWKEGGELRCFIVSDAFCGGRRAIGSG